LKDRLIAELRAEIALLRKMLEDRKIPLPSERQIQEVLKAIESEDD
jgi:hypothetical protein